MAHYNDRWQNPRDYDRQDWRDKERERERDRGMWNRGSDEVRSWFGDDDAERRRQYDEMRERNRESGAGRDYGEWRRQPANYGNMSGADREYYGGREAFRGERSGATSFDRGWGPYYGRGPRGYRRSDERIREDVCDRLTDAPDVDATDIEVHVANAEVTLRGNVGTRTEKRRAEDLAEQISGVNDVRNEIRVTGERLGTTELDLTGSRKPSAIGETPKSER